MNQLTLKLNFGANTEGRECSLTLSSHTTAVKCTQLLHNNIVCRKEEKNKPTLVTNLLTHYILITQSCTFESCAYVFIGASTPVFKEATPKVYSRISSIQLCFEFY